MKKKFCLQPKEKLNVYTQSEAHKKKKKWEQDMFGYRNVN